MIEIVWENKMKNINELKSKNIQQIANALRQCIDDYSFDGVKCKWYELTLIVPEFLCHMDALGYETVILPFINCPQFAFKRDSELQQTVTHAALVSLNRSLEDMEWDITVAYDMKLFHIG